MIEIPTVFVLGAGASKPYGFPTALELTTSVTEFTWAHPYDDVLSLLRHNSCELEGFQRALVASRINSVDRFLEVHSKEKGFLRLGKHLMAMALIRCEHPPNLTQARGDWLRHVWNAMLTSRLENVSDNRIAIITFNYDRVVEQYLLDAICGAYGCTPGLARSQLEKIPFVHVYGSLGHFPRASSVAEDERPFRSRIDAIEVETAAKSLWIAPEERTEESFAAARKLIRKARRVVFVGFGFDPMNSHRLMPQGDWLAWMQSGGAVFGSALGLQTRERATAKQLFGEHPNVTLGGPGDDALYFLREYLNLTEVAAGG